MNLFVHASLHLIVNNMQLEKWMQIVVICVCVLSGPIRLSLDILNNDCFELFSSRNWIIGWADNQLDMSRVFIQHTMAHAISISSSSVYNIFSSEINGRSVMALNENEISGLFFKLNEEINPLGNETIRLRWKIISFQCNAYKNPDHFLCREHTSL